MKIPIEDEYYDIIQKTQAGLSISDEQLSEQTGISSAEIARIRHGELKDEPLLKKMAPALDLDPESLVVSAQQSWYPQEINIQGLALLNTPFHDMTVNAYLVWNPENQEGVAFDTGADSRPMIEFIEQENLSISAIFLTHTHGDHIADLDRLHSHVGDCPVYVHKKEQIATATPIEEGFEFSFGDLKLRSLHTSGHSVGGMSYIIEGLEHPIAIVGDALFAGSMGGGMISFEEALQNNRNKLMTLPNNTIICPGHGPMSTIAEEKQHNPFFPEFK